MLLIMFMQHSLGFVQSFPTLKSQIHVDLKQTGIWMKQSSAC